MKITEFTNENMIKLAVVLTFLSVALCQENFGFLKAVGNDKYYISLYELEYIQAYAACKRYGWRLATEQTVEESTALNNALKSVGATAVDYWLGGFYQVNKEFNPTWMWLDSGEDLTFVNWQNGDLPATGYNCLLKRSLDDNGGKWISSACSNSKRFICKKRISINN